MRPVLEFRLKQYHFAILSMENREDGYKAHVKWEGEQAFLPAFVDPIGALKSVMAIPELCGLWSDIVREANSAAKRLKLALELESSLILDSDIR